jgi:hypothetical protein
MNTLNFARNKKPVTRKIVSPILPYFTGMVRAGTDKIAVQ